MSACAQHRGDSGGHRLARRPFGEARGKVPDLTLHPGSWLGARPSAQQYPRPEVDLPLLDSVVLGEPRGHGENNVLDRPQLPGIGRPAHRGQGARIVDGLGQPAHEEVVVLAEALDGLAHLAARRGIRHLPCPLVGGEQCGKEVQVPGPDVHGKARPLIIELREYFARVAALVVICVFDVTKFVHSAWLVVVIIPLLVLMFRSIHSHYAGVVRQLSTEGLGQLHEIRNTVVVPISGIHRGVINALQYARSISPNGVKAV